MAVGKAGFGRLPGRPGQGAVGKVRLAAAQSGGAGGGFTALYRIFDIGILLVWCDGGCQAVGQPPNQVGAGGGALLISTLAFSWLGAVVVSGFGLFGCYRFCHGLRLDVSAHGRGWYALFSPALGGGWWPTLRLWRRWEPTPRIVASPVAWPTYAFR